MLTQLHPDQFQCSVWSSIYLRLFQLQEQFCKFTVMQHRREKHANAYLHLHVTKEAVLQYILGHLYIYWATG